MELSPRQVAFVKDEMQKIEGDETRQPTVQVEARRIKKQAEATLNE
jgi:hypothetical protein